jgi:hypothetical protein
MATGTLLEFLMQGPNTPRAWEPEPRERVNVEEREARIPWPYILTDQEQADSDALLAPVFEQYPALQEWLPDLVVKDSRHRYGRPEDASKEPSRRGGLEYFPSTETGDPRLPSEYNRPFPGHRAIELYKPIEEKGDSVSQSIFGDILHALPEVSPEFAALKQEFGDEVWKNSNNRQWAHRKFDETDPGNRNFQEWFAGPHLDAYIRGLLSPDKANEWKDQYTPEMEAIGMRMMSLIGPTE